MLTGPRTERTSAAVTRFPSEGKGPSSPSSTARVRSACRQGTMPQRSLALRAMGTPSLLGSNIEAAIRPWRGQPACCRPTGARGSLSGHSRRESLALPRGSFFRQRALLRLGASTPAVEPPIPGLWPVYPCNGAARSSTSVTCAVAFCSRLTAACFATVAAPTPPCVETRGTPSLHRSRATGAAPTETSL